VQRGASAAPHPAAFENAAVLLGTSVQYLIQFGLVDGQPVLEAYLERCRARPAYQRALAIEKA
jgi:glutathione S-transferase